MATDYASCMAEVGDANYCAAQFPDTAPGRQGDTSAAAATGTSFAVGSFIKDQQGNIWEIKSTSGAFPGVKLVSGNIPGAQFRMLDQLISRVGRFFLTETGRAIEVEPDGTFRQLTVSESGNLFPAGGPGGPSGPGRTQFPSERSLDIAQADRLAAQTEIDRENLLLSQQQLEENARSERMRSIRDLINARIGERSQARGQATQMAGFDPTRSLGMLRGQQLKPGFRSPFDIFKEGLYEAARFEEPEIAPGASISDLENVIAKLEGSILPENPPVLGFARGTPGAGIGILVGENRDGTINDTTEVLELSPTRQVKRVIPLMARAQAGLDFTDFEDIGGFGPLFSSLRQSAGLPRTLSPAQHIGGPLRGLLGAASAPSDRGPGPRPAEFGAIASPLSARMGIRELFLAQGLSPVAARQAADRMNELIGVVPAPHKIPTRFFEALIPQEQTALLGLYKLMGFTEDDFRHLITAPLLTGGAQQGLTAVA